jgi:peptidoglycan/LPS O-acetylase OafA/YrhL
MPSIIGTARSHIRGIDGLRALAAFAVVAHHVGYDTGTMLHARFGVILEQLDIGVPIFFVISGFLLGGPFVRRLLDSRSIDGFGRFWLRRAVRIYPAYWLVLTCMVLFLGTSIASLYEFVMLFGLLQIYDADMFFKGMVQAWTLCTEVSFYAALPFFALLAARVLRRCRRIRSDTALLIGCALLYVISTAWRLCMYGFHPSFGRIALTWLPGQLDLFALGMALAVVRGRSDRDERFARRVESLVRSPMLWWAAAAAVFALTCLVGLRRPVVGADAPLVLGNGKDFARQIAFGAVALFLLVPVALRRRPDRATAITLGSRPMVLLGVLSYGVYLWHKSLIPKVQGWFGWGAFEGNFWVVFVLVSALATVLAWVTYRLVEAPALRLATGGPLRVTISESTTPDRDGTTTT